MFLLLKYTLLYTVVLMMVALGGMFSEGIDLAGESLIGAIVVGTGMPQLSAERNIMAMYYDEKNERGHEFAYTCPGMNKVMQAAGRVIRTVEDIGIVALIDDRFLESAYQKMFPREWGNFEVVEVGNVAKRVEKFWNEWLL